MRNAAAHLPENVLSDELPRAPTRDGFGTGVVAAGERDHSVVVLCADLKESTRAEVFEKAFPERYIEVGVAEQNMAALAAGLALAGKTPFITSYAAFSPGRNYEQIRTTIALNQVKVVVCGMHAGVSVGPDGATHQMLEDLGLMRMLPGMTVIAPADSLEAHKAVLAAAALPGPSYIRFGRAPVPTFTTPDTPFVLGAALPLFDRDDAEVGLVATGPQSYTMLCAAHTLLEKGIKASVLHVPTVKPLDGAALVALAKRTKGIVTLEEHQTAGGFGSAVSEYLAEAYPTRVLRLGVQDQFGQSGTPVELARHYHLDVADVVAAAERLSSHALPN